MGGSNEQITRYVYVPGVANKIWVHCDADGLIRTVKGTKCELSGRKSSYRLTTCKNLADKIRLATLLHGKEIKTFCPSRIDIVSPPPHPVNMKSLEHSVLKN